MKGMRIQQTDQILKESKNARHNAKKHPVEVSFFTKIKQAISNLFHH